MILCLAANRKVRVCGSGEMARPAAVFACLINWLLIGLRELLGGIKCESLQQTKAKNVSFLLGSKRRVAETLRSCARSRFQAPAFGLDLLQTPMEIWVTREAFLGQRYIG